jgi:WNK lysine deficient protein kinase
MSTGSEWGATGSTFPRKTGQMPEEFDFPLKEYQDDDTIEVLVEDTATATKRGPEKASEWLAKLHKQDIMTVGDLRDLQEEDWSNL